MTGTATVFGARGFIGRHLVQRLRSQGFEVHEPSREDCADVQVARGHVFYCAGLTADFVNRPHDTVDAHVSLLNHVLRESRFESLVYLSSTRLYDGLQVDVADECTPLALDPGLPRHLYDLSKALGEVMCHTAGKGRARVARLSCVYRDASDGEGFLPRLLRELPQALARAEPGQRPWLQVDTTPHAARDYVQLDDVLDALVLIGTQGTQTVYNVASGCNVSNGALFERVRDLCDCEIIASQRHRTPLAPRIDITRMRREFGWQPQGLLDGLPALLAEPLAC